MSHPLLENIKGALFPIAERFALKVVGEVDEGNYTAVLYQKASVGLRVAVDWSEFRPFLTIYELGPEGFVNGESALVRADGRGIAFDIDDLLKLRMVRSSPVGKMLAERSDAAARRLLDEYAQALKEAAGDVLAGDFTVFDELDRIVRVRKRQFSE